MKTPKRGLLVGSRGDMNECHNSYRYIPPLEGSDVVEKWLEDERSQARINDELTKQQFLLDLLHSKISARHERGKSTAELDENAWQVQNSVTAIKRKLKQLVDSCPTTTIVPFPDTRCIEMYEEKQLMATREMLREDIRDERQRVAALCWQLRNLERNGQFAEVENGIIGDEADEEEDKEQWMERCKLEEAARGALLEEITRLRMACVDLRARFDMETSFRSELPNYDSGA